MRTHKVKIIGTGGYLPGKPIKFDEINKVLGELNEVPKSIGNWVKRMEPLMKDMLGIEQYYYAIDPETREFTETNITMSVKAAQKAMKDADIKPDDIDLLLYGSSSLEQMPPTSTRIQEALGIESCAEMSIQSNCTSVYKSIMLAHDLISLGRYKTVMVVSSNMASSSARAEFFNQKMIQREQVFLRWFLCDGAGCMIFTRDDNEVPKGNYLEASYIESIGGLKEPMMYNRKESYSMNPLEVYEKGLHHIGQNRTNIRDDDSGESFLTNSFMEGLKRMANEFDIDLSKTTHFNINFPAQHIYEFIKEKCCSIGIPESSYYAKLRDFGYVGPPMVLITMDKLLKEEDLKYGTQIISFVLEVSNIMQAGFMIKSY